MLVMKKMVKDKRTIVVLVRSGSIIGHQKLVTLYYTTFREAKRFMV